MSLCQVCSCWGGPLFRPFGHHTDCPLLVGRERALAGAVAEIVSRWDEIEAAGMQAGQVEQDYQADIFERARMLEEILTTHLARQ